MDGLIGSLPGQSREQMPLDIQLVPHRRLSLEGRFIVGHGDLHRLIIVQSETKPGLSKVTQIAANVDNRFDDIQLLMKRLPSEIGSCNSGGQSQPHLSLLGFFGGRMASTDKSLHTKDFVKAAQADGFRYAERLASKADVPRVVREWLAFDGPAFLEVMIDPDAGVYPMVGPGLSYFEMITGDFIPNRYKLRKEPEPDQSESF